MLWLGVIDERLALDGAGDRGRTGSSSEKTGVGGTRTGKDVVGSSSDDDDADGDGDGASFDCSGQDGGGKTVGRPAVVPWVWRVRMIASQAVSRVRTRSRNAQFSASRAASAARCSGLPFIREG